MYPFFYIFLTPKITNRPLKKSPGSLHLPLLSFLQYLDNYLGQRIKHILNNYLGQPILNQYTISK